jgi:hypothetical protein
MGAFSVLEIRLIGAVVALVGIFGLALYLEHRGAEKCVAANVAAVQVQDAHNASVAAVQDVVIAQEKKDYVEAVDRPLVRPITLQLCDAAPAVVPAPQAPRPKPDAAAPSPAVDRKPVVPSTTLGPGLQRTGQQADAQIAALQAYVRDVCLKR